MANQPETATYDAGVYQIETTDAVKGGVGGIANQPLLNLANRTAYLKQHVDNLENGTTIPPTVAPLNSPGLTGSPTAPTAPAGDNSTSIANTSFVQSLVNGVATVNVAGNANVVLTAAQYGTGIIVFTGALTGNISVTFPNNGHWIVSNTTTGAYTLTCKTAAGTGVNVQQANAEEIFGDGTNIDLVGGQASVSYSPMVAVGSITLDATYVGKLVTDNASGVTVTLPPANSVQAGAPISFIQQQGGTFTIQRNGTDTLMTVDEWNATSHSMTALGQTVKMVSDGIGHWYCLSNSAANNVGQVAYFAMSSPPMGWIAADGSALSRTTYATLFAKIGTTFGAGDGATTFNVIDARGQFLRGYDNGRGLDSGRTFGSSQSDSYKSHTHGLTNNGASNGTWTDQGGTYLVNPGGSVVQMTHVEATDASGGSETRPTNVALLACIKY